QAQVGSVTVGLEPERRRAEHVGARGLMVLLGELGAQFRVVQVVPEAVCSQAAGFCGFHDVLKPGRGVILEAGARQGEPEGSLGVPALPARRKTGQERQEAPVAARVRVIDTVVPDLVVRFRAVALDETEQPPFKDETGLAGYQFREFRTTPRVRAQIIKINDDIRPHYSITSRPVPRVWLSAQQPAGRAPRRFRGFSSVLRGSCSTAAG